MRRRFLVAGGAGFVGSHTVLALLDRGDEVVVLDNLRTGHARAVPAPATLVLGDIGDRALLDDVLGAGTWDGVFHFAALSLVGESMRQPILYFQENVAKSFTLIEACLRHGTSRLVFSSSAAVFGDRGGGVIEEEALKAPDSAYGESKLMVERALDWAARVHGLRPAVLRYFNAAGADPEGRAGEDHTPETHLIPIAIDAALQRRPPLQVFGTDYATRDGTCVRDYVHVTDLATAHLLAVEAPGPVTWNLGNGQGATVMEVLRAVERVTGRAVPHGLAPRRPGDPPSLVAAAGRIRREAGWQPRFGSLEMMIDTAYAWRLRHPRGWRTEAAAA